MRVGPFRKAAKVPYPNAYASPEQIAAASAEDKQALYLFNCAQRAHYNFLENHLNMLAPMLIAGVQFPIASAVTGVAWSVFRLLYALGYTSKTHQNGKGRMAGSGFWLAQLVLAGLAGYSGVKMLS